MKRVAVVLLLVVLAVLPAQLFAKTFYCGFFNNKSESVTKISASPAGKNQWIVVSTSTIGSNGTAKLSWTFGDDVGEWDFKATTASGKTYTKKINVWYKSDLAMSEMDEGGAADDSGGAQYAVKVLNRTGSDVVKLMVKDYNAGEWIDVPISKTRSGSSVSVKFSAGEGISDWDVAVQDADGALYAKSMVSIDQTIVMNKEDLLQNDEEGGIVNEDDGTYETYDEDN